MKNRYMPTAIGLYINYFVHGMGVLLLTLNMSSLQVQWDTDAAGISIVISSLGIGRLIVLFVSGYLSDKFGRKPFVYLGMVSYIAFFIGILLSPTIAVAYVFGILAGIANSFLDSGTYPALMESFPKSPGTANVMIKAFISGGQFALPILINIIAAVGVWFGWSFLTAAIIMVVNALFLLKRPFPDQNKTDQGNEQQKEESTIHFKDKPKFAIEGIAFILYGYVAQATFYLVSQWLAQYGENVANMSHASAVSLLSIYTIGSLCCVFFTSAMVKKAVRPVTFLVIYTFISFIALLLVSIFPSPIVVMIFAFVFGFSAAGGVMQLGLTVMATMFPSGKGKVTGIFYTAGSIASFTIPLVTAQLSKTSIQSIMWFDVFIAAAGFLIAIVIAYRYRKVILD